MGIRHHLKNAIRIQGIPKLVELGLLFIILLLTRVGGGSGNPLAMGDSEHDAEAFGHMVVYGYCFIVLIQLIGIVVEEDMNLQNLLYTVLGALFFFAVGGAQIGSVVSTPGAIAVPDESNRLAHGSLCIIESLVFSIDTAIQVWKYRSERT